MRSTPATPGLASSAPPRPPCWWSAICCGCANRTAAGSRFVLLVSTLGMSLYPALVALTHNTVLLVVYAGAVGIFQAGVDLVFFDELMKTVPPEYSPTFVSLAQSIQYLSTIFAPLLGTLLAEYIGLSGALIASAVIRLVGFLLFARPDRR